MNILITGGTGSLGRALIGDLLAAPTFTKICIYSRDEHKQEDVRRQFNDNPKLRYFIGDVRDKDRLKLACRDIQFIIHTAAMKVVPVAEYNPFEAIKTNIIGAQNVVEAAIANVHANYPRVIAVSTDKAVSPINLYGATKLSAEKIFLAGNNIMGLQGPRFSVCRYGNVANSNGSVIPVYRNLLSQGKQLPVTHTEMTRFWITLKEAVWLVKYAMEHMYGGETFIPEMPSFKIHELALVMMEAYPSEKQWAEIIGIRPGEKLHEDIITKQEMERVTYMMDQGLYIVDKYDRQLSAQPVSNALTSNSPEVIRLSPDELRERVNECV